MSSLLRTPAADARGASAVEYALLVAMIAAVVVTGVLALGVNVAALFDVDIVPGG